MSFRHILPIAVAVSLSGCSLTTSEQHQQTLAAIEKLDTSINTRVVQLEDSLQQQKQQITQLEFRLSSLSQNLEKMRQDHAKIPTAAETRTIVKERLVPMPVHGNKAILGQQEWVWIDKVKSNFRARVDTGAATSSLNAVDLQEFERDGKKWVRFSLAHDENEAKEQQLSVEAPVARWVRIRQSSLDEAVRRPVVELWVRVGNLHEKAQFTLTDRSQMDFPVLLGREFFKDIAVVDVSKEYTHDRHQDKTAEAATTTAPKQADVKKQDKVNS
ncbi:ATP-dependent zinc protease [Parasalinivibrio latis]|uniref:ATP-dependent zinc protease family protein n=1 Tax=Parasalinivibrio latis TaxID=2952610 RepID=UPI0030DFE14F